jgi:hypothetical protein
MWMLAVSGARPCSGGPGVVRRADHLSGAGAGFLTRCRRRLAILNGVMLLRAREADTLKMFHPFSV